MIYLRSLRRISASSLNTGSIQIVRGAYNIDLNKVDQSFTKLHRACLLNDEPRARKQINKINCNSHDTSKRYPIHLATVNGNYEIVKLLLDHKANPNVQDNEGKTPIIKAIECGHQQLVKYLLDNGADPNITDYEKNTALHWAIITENLLAVDSLLSSNKCDFSIRNQKQETCLHLAMRSPSINANTFEEILGAKKMCDEYKRKFISKNKENLEYEQRNIELTSQIKHLKVDLGFIEEQNEKLMLRLKDVEAENQMLKGDKDLLLGKLRQLNTTDEDILIISSNNNCTSQKKSFNETDDNEIIEAKVGDKDEHEDDGDTDNQSNHSKYLDANDKQLDHQINGKYIESQDIKEKNLQQQQCKSNESINEKLSMRSRCCNSLNSSSSLIDCKEDEEEFIKVRNRLQERINMLKNELSLQL